MNLCNSLNIKVNVDGLAKGMLGMVEGMDECYKNALKLGMLPQPLMKMLDEGLEKKFREDLTVHTLDGKPPKLDDKLFVVLEDGIERRPFTLRKLISEVSSAVSKAMYRHADMVV